jgi:WhiB family redox-sensing transcriptional regulator
MQPCEGQMRLGANSTADGAHQSAVPRFADGAGPYLRRAIAPIDRRKDAIVFTRNQLQESTQINTAAIRLCTRGERHGGVPASQWSGDVSCGPSGQLRVGRRKTAVENWRVIAACQFIDPELFFPISTAGKSLEQVVEAKQVCARCLVQAECLTFAQQTGQVHGIWGGLTEEERIQVVRSRQRGTPADARRATAAGLQAI